MTFWDTIGSLAKTGSPLLGVFDAARVASQTEDPNDGPDGTAENVKQFGAAFFKNSVQAPARAGLQGLTSNPVQKALYPIVWTGNQADHTLAALGTGVDAEQAQGRSGWGILWDDKSWDDAWAKTENISFGELFTETFTHSEYDAADRAAITGYNLAPDAAKIRQEFEANRDKTGFRVAAGAMDILATWYADPTIVGGKAVKAARVGSRIIDGIHADEVAGVIGKVGKRGLADRAAGVFSTAPEETASRLHHQIRTRNVRNMTDAAASFAPELARSGDAAPVVGLIGQAGDIADDAVRWSVQADVILAAAGSKVARDRLMTSAPDIARAFQRSTLPPEQFAIVDNMVAEGLTGKALLNATKAWSTKGNKAELKAYAKNLDAVHDRLAAIAEVGARGGVEQVSAGALGAVKQKYRAGMAHEFFYSPGPHGRVVRAVHWATGQRMKGVIDVADPYRGHDELMDQMTRSGLFTAAERQRLATKWWSAPTKEARAGIAHAYPVFLLAKLAEKHGLTKSEMKDILKEYGSWSASARTYTTKAMEQARLNNESRVLLEDPGSGIPTSIDKLLFEKHVADSAAVPDVFALERLVRARRGATSKADRFKDKMSPLWNQMEDINDIWRTLTLARPGFVARTQFDTQARSMVTIGATNIVADAMRGLGHKFTDKLTGAQVQEVIDHADAQVITGKHLVTDERTLDLGNGVKASTRAANSDVERKMLTPALHTGPQSISDAILHVSGKMQGHLVEDANNWVTHMPDSDKWSLAWLRSKDALVASPAGRKILEVLDLPNVDMVKALKSSPEVRAAYREVRTGNPDFDQWLDRAVMQAEWTAPTTEVRQALLSGGDLKETDVEAMFAKFGDEKSALPQRMPVHAPALDYINPAKQRHNLMDQTRKFVRWMSDQPDTVLGRVPFYTERYFKHFEELGRREVARNGELGAEARLAIEKVARHRAIQDTRQTMYDTARFTGAHDRSARMMFAFLGAWEDSMRAWGRMFYDDPSRIGKLTKTWYAPDRGGFIVDENGDRVHPGDDSREKWIVLPLPIPGNEVKEFRLRKDSFNSMFQGEVPWAPGFSPMVQVPVTQVAARTFPEIADPNYTVKGVKVGESALLRQLFGFGLPKTGVTAGQQTVSVIDQLTPGWMRRMTNVMNGQSQQFADAYAMGLNAALIEAKEQGKDVNSKAVQEWADKRARDTARSATMLEFVANFGLGLSGEGATKAEFYRERYREISANADALKARGTTVQEEFLRQHPEAAGLKWSFSENQTGINATLQVENRSRKFERDIQKNPEFGWFYVGSDNIGGEFSAAIYSSQFNREGTPGSGEAWRSRQNPAEIRKATASSLGWDSWNAVSEKVNLVLQQRGLTSVNQKGAEDLKKIKADFKATLATENPDWFKDYNNFDSSKMSSFIDQVARPALKDGRLKNRADIKSMADYLELRQKAMDIANKNGYSLGSNKAANLRQILNDAGAAMAADNLGFSQMWTRVLSREVDE